MSFNFPNFYIRHQNFQGELQKFDAGGPKEDFVFDEEYHDKDTDGVSLVRFRSTNYERYYLRNKDFRIYLEHDDGTDLFRQDSTFRRWAGLAADPEQGWRSYEASNSNLRGHFIRHRDFHIFMDDRPNLKPDATFKKMGIDQIIDENP
jgi:hypothetical protein